MKIVILEPLAISDEKLNSCLKPLLQNGHDIQIFKDRTENPEELIKRGKRADILILTNIPLPKQVIEGCPNLKMISVAFSGVDHIDLAVCRQRNIVVCNASGYSTHSVAELTIGMMITLLRNILESNSQTRKRGTRNHLIGNELSHKTVGVIGTGNIGIEVTRLLRAFGCEVLGFSRSKRADFIQLGGKYTTLDDIIERVDIITLHLPLSPETKGMTIMMP